MPERANSRLSAWCGVSARRNPDRVIYFVARSWKFWKVACCEGVVQVLLIAAVPALVSVADVSVDPLLRAARCGSRYQCVIHE